MGFRKVAGNEQSEGLGPEQGILQTPRSGAQVHQGKATSVDAEVEVFTLGLGSNKNMVPPLLFPGNKEAMILQNKNATPFPVLVGSGE